MNELTDEFSLPVFVIEINTNKILYCNPTMKQLINKDCVNLYANDIKILAELVSESGAEKEETRLISKSGWINYVHNFSSNKLGSLNVSKKYISYLGVSSLLYVINTDAAPTAVSAKIVGETSKIFNTISNFSSDHKSTIQNILGLIGETFNADCVISFMDNEPFNKYFYCADENQTQSETLEKALQNNIEELVEIYKNYNANVIYKISSQNSNSIFQNFNDENPGFCKENLSKYLIPLRYPSSIKNDGMILMMNCKKDYTENEFVSSLANMLGFFYYIISNENQIEELSFYDNLTGFYNRNSFIKIRQNLCNTPPDSLGVVFIDINGLKYTNDTYGHNFGDTVIISTSDSIKSVFNRNSVYRIGGDEFVIIVPNITREYFEDRISKLERILISDQTSSVSIGTSYEQSNQVNLNTMLEEADKKMYQQKQMFYELQKKQPGICEMHLCHLESQIKEGIENGQFSIYIRPRFNLKGHYLVGADSILHINKPIFNISNSFQLVSLLEKADLMYPIDCYMIKLNCEFHRRLIKKYGKSVTTSINFSNRTFLHKDFKTYLINLVNKYKVPFKYINLQIIYLEKQISPDLIATVNELNKMGFHTSINHFGVGESVYKPLQKLSLNSVKLDNSLTPALENHKGVITLKSILKMTNDLKIDACLDSIMSEDQIKKAIKIGFKTGRGDYYSKSVTTKKFETLYIVPDLEKL